MKIGHKKKRSLKNNFGNSNIMLNSPFRYSNAHFNQIIREFYDTNETSKASIVGNYLLPLGVITFLIAFLILYNKYRKSKKDEIEVPYLELNETEMEE